MDIFRKKDNQYGKRGNVMTPLNWMCGICETLLCVLAYNHYHNWLGKSAFIVFFIILLFYAGMYIFYSIKDPNRLQTEEYNLESQRLAVISTGENLINFVSENSKITTSDLEIKK
tara:strand:+ start:208 stop:552 length:345 start_codon:yes stop_codon:yes gene_type:complete